MFTEEELENETQGEWYLRQILGSANFTGGRLMHIMSGSLGYQIEHHLFPDLPSNRYPEIAVRVRALCEKYELPYTTGPFPRQFWQATRSIWRLSLPARKIREANNKRQDRGLPRSRARCTRPEPTARTRRRRRRPRRPRPASPPGPPRTAGTAQHDGPAGPPGRRVRAVSREHGTGDQCVDDLEAAVEDREVGDGPGDQPAEIRAAQQPGGRGGRGVDGGDQVDARPRRPPGCRRARVPALPARSPASLRTTPSCDGDRDVRRAGRRRRASPRRRSRR